MPPIWEGIRQPVLLAVFSNCCFGQTQHGYDFQMQMPWAARCLVCLLFAYCDRGRNKALFECVPTSWVKIRQYPRKWTASCTVLGIAKQHAVWATFSDLSYLHLPNAAWSSKAVSSVDKCHTGNECWLITR